MVGALLDKFWMRNCGLKGNLGTLKVIAYIALVIMEDEPTLSGLEDVNCAFLLPLICQFP
jgi:hypothetical protein